MDETFIININCSRILSDSPETRYTMFIDTTKISIVYELVEWIRWIFSVENCIYLTHDNSVIHELEDIRVLFKLKDFQIKPCGRPNCVHKKPYRKLLNKRNLFVNWNEMKIHKYFLEKLNKMDKKLVRKKNKTIDHIKPTKTKNSCILVESEQENSNRKISLEKSCDIQQSNSNLYGHALQTKRVLIDDLESDSAPICDSSFEINCFDNKKNPEKKLLVNFEDSCDGSNNSFNSINTNAIINTKNYGEQSLLKSHLRRSPSMESKLETENHDSKNRIVSNSHKSPNKFLKPFSLGKILSNLREDFEKQNMEGALKKNGSAGEGNKSSSEKLFATETIKGKKRQRTRKRKKTKKQEVKNENLILPILQKSSFTQKFNIYNGNSNLKPNHIRFSEEEEEQLMETDTVENESEKKIENEFEIDLKINELITFVKLETPKLVDDCQNFSNELVVSPLKSTVENETVEGEDKVIDLNDGGSVDNLHSCSAVESFESASFCQDSNMLQSLKEKLKNSVVVNRFY